jgi:preprotein translocase SecE subunit
MALGIYKPGQGYWVRVMTATLIALATTAVAAWAWSQTATVVSQLPKTSFTLGVRNATTEVPGGTTVTLLGTADATGKQLELGTAVVRTPITKTAGDQRVTIDSVEMNAGFDAGGTASLRAVNGEKIAEVAERRGNPPVEPQVAQSIVATILILIGATLAYYFTATRPKTVDFLIATDYEMKRVNWSTRREIVGSTVIVIIASIALATTLFVFDLTLQWFFKTIDVLQI